MPVVKTIPARFTSAPVEEKKTKRRVAAYARVSTDRDEQFTSYEAQVDYYTKYIKGRDDWEFVKVYTDEGITGTNTKHRTGFKTMVADALAGGIDLIVTKSVSRFARNTVDSLTTIRELKEHGVEVFFEKENIWTFDGRGELLITIMSSLAQEESRSISQNSTWGLRKRYADGKVSLAYARFLGYDRNEHGAMVINPEQAKIVRDIYDMFLQGMSFNSIATKLMENGVKTACGKDKWASTQVKSILTNEKYKGDALLQKSFTVDYLTKKKKKNEGEIPQYYVEGSHEAIIEPEKFDAVQREIARREAAGHYHSSIHPFSCKIKCGECGSWYGSKVWHSNSKYQKNIWRCNHKYDGEQQCSTPALTDEQIESAFLSAANKLLRTKEEVIANGREACELMFGTSELEAERDNLLKDMQTIADAVKQGIYENAHKAINQKDYQSRYDELVAQYDSMKERFETLTEQIDKANADKAKVEEFIANFEKMPDELLEFNRGTFNALVDFMTIYGDMDIRVTFRNGQEVQA